MSDNLTPTDLSLFDQSVLNNVKSPMAAVGQLVSTDGVETEIEDHKTDLNSWINKVETLPVTESRKGVSERFVRDCKIMLQDLDTNTNPSAADLIDYTDRHHSLEIQHLNILSDSQ